MSYEADSGRWKGNVCLHLDASEALSDPLGPKSQLQQQWWWRLESCENQQSQVYHRHRALVELDAETDGIHKNYCPGVFRTG